MLTFCRARRNARTAEGRAAVDYAFEVDLRGLMRHIVEQRSCRGQSRQPAARGIGRKSITETAAPERALRLRVRFSIRNA